MNIDSHQHFWEFDPVRDAWIDETMQVLRRDFLLADLAPALQESGFDGTVAVQADSRKRKLIFCWAWQKRMIGYALWSAGLI